MWPRCYYSRDKNTAFLVIRAGRFASLMPGASATPGRAGPFEQQEESHHECHRHTGTRRVRQQASTRRFRPGPRELRARRDSADDLVRNGCRRAAGRGVSLLRQ